MSTTRVKCWVGIDPGKQGGIVFLSEDNSFFESFVIPLIGDVVDRRQLSEILSLCLEYDSIIILEDVHALYGASAASTWDFGFICGLLEGIIGTLGIQMYKIKPKAWQQQLFVGIPVIKKDDGKTNDTKKMALLAARNLYPAFTGLATPRSKKPHDGLIDALCLAHYGKQNYR